MKLKAIVPLSLLLTGAIFCFGSYALCAEDPEFQGRKLSAWLNDLENMGLWREAVRPEDGQRHRQAIVAIRQMGTNIVPALLAFMREPDTNAYHGMVTRQRQAGAAIALFGAEAKFAIPELIELFKAERHQSAGPALALAGIGLDAIVPLSQALTNADRRMHRGAAEALSSICHEHHREQTSLGPAVPALTKALKDNDVEVRKIVATSMRDLGSEAVPAVLASLSDPNADVRNELVQALPTYDYNPIPLIAALKRLRNDPDNQVRAAVRDAIERLSQ